MNRFSRFIVDAAYALQASQKYRLSKRFFYNLLENGAYPYKRIFDYTMMLLIFASVFILIREVKFHVNDWLLFFNNYIISIVFLIEYLLRMWVHSSVSETIVKQYEEDEFIQRNFRLKKALGKALLSKLNYMRSLTAIVDLLAIMPFFHQLRLLRLFILFRVFKLFRYAHSLQQFLSVLSTKKFELLTLLVFASIIIFVSGVLIYVMEANNPESPIDTLFEAFYWALVTISTVGYGDLAPVSEEGRAVAMVIIVAGIAVISFVTSIVVTSFTERMDDIKENKLISDVIKLKRFYLICGYSDVARHVGAKLAHRKHNVVVLDKDAALVKEAASHGFIAMQYDPGSLQSYRRLRIDFDKQVQAALCLKEDDVQNVYSALTVRSIHESVQIISVLISRQNRKKLELAGVNEVVYTQELIGMTAKEFSGKPVAFEAIHALRSEQSGVLVEEIVVDERLLESANTVGELDFERFRLILMGIHQSGTGTFMFNPHAATPLHEGDIMLIIGTQSLINEFRRFAHKKRSR